MHSEVSVIRADHRGAGVHHPAAGQALQGGPHTGRHGAGVRLL